MDTTRTALEVGFSDLSIGSYSVGLPPSRTGEQIIAAYIDLVTLVRRDKPKYLRDEDFIVLSNETNLDCAFIKNRVKTHLANEAVAI